MPTFNTAHYLTQLSTRDNPSRLPAANVVSGDVQFAVARYTLTAGTDEAADDIINLCILPAGAIPLPHLSKIVCDADPGTAFTVDVGTAALVDGWGDAVALTTAGIVEFTAAAHTMPDWLVQTPLVADSATQGNVVVFATVKTSTAPTAGVNLDFILAYKLGK